MAVCFLPVSNLSARQTNKGFRKLGVIVKLEKKTLFFPVCMRRSLGITLTKIFHLQVDWGGKGSTEAGARLTEAKVTKVV